MRWKRLPAYMVAAFRTIRSSPPRNVLKLLSRSPYTVKDLPAYGVSILVDIRDPAISKPILALGEYEPALTRQLMACIHENSHFLDIGANIGFFSLLAARRASSGRVWSLEPDPRNFSLLTAGIALNRLRDIIDARQVAASDTSDSLFFSSLGYESNLGARFSAKTRDILLERSLPGAGEPIRVPARRVDDLLEGETVDVVKVDVEGFEPAVFSGMRTILERCRPTVFTEFAPGTIQHISKTDPADLLGLFRELGYRMAVIEEHGAIARDSSDILNTIEASGEHHLDLLLTPNERKSGS